MSLIPSIQINFDGGGGLADDDDYILDSSGVGHFHPVKAGSTWIWRLVLVGVNTTDLTFDMDIRATIGSATEILSTGLTGDALITVTKDPDGDNTEEVQFSVSSAGTALLQSQGSGMAFVYDIHVTDNGETDRWVTGSGVSTPAVTR